LHNYFIMHDVKYFFLNKNNRIIRRRQKKFPQRDKLSKILLKKTIFQNGKRAVASGLVIWRRVPRVRAGYTRGVWQ
jgi:hypothetical protein